MESNNKIECEYLLEYLGYCKKKNSFIGRDGKYCEECKKNEENGIKPF